MMKILLLTRCLLLGLSASLSVAHSFAAETFAKQPARPVDFAQEKTLYTIGYSHLDTQWRWVYPKVIREYIPDTMLGNFALFEKFPNYVFNFTGSRRYEFMKEYYPADYERVKQYIAAGRWFPNGSSVDEGDAIVPSLESIVRNTLYGNRFFEREFSQYSDEFMLPDCFGFPWALPSILAHCGIKGFSTQKLPWGSAVGIPFKVGNWAGPDGVELVSALDPGGYAAPVKENLSLSKEWEKRIRKNGGFSGSFVDYHYYGTGDRGGAPDAKSVEWIEQALATPGPVRVLSSRADDLFNDLQPEQIHRLPKYSGELLLTEHSAGSITSQATMKRWNRKNELLADAAERASVGAFWLGAAYPSKVFYDAWNLILGSQMHDILPGTSLPKAYEYSWNDEIIAANLLAETTRHGVEVIAAALDTRAEGVPLVVYNPLALAREDLVEATVEFSGGAPAAVRVFGPEGRETPSQLLERQDRRVRLLFQAQAPSVGWAVYDVRPADSAYAEAAGLRIDTQGLENVRYRVTLNAQGDVASIRDKSAQRELLSAPLRLEFLAERPQDYPAWNMDWRDRQKPPLESVAGPAQIRIIENGPLRVTLEVERHARGSRFRQRIRLAQGEAGQRVEFPTQIDWKTTGVSLKQSFPLAVKNPLATYDSQLGTIQRNNNHPKKYEVPQHQWFDLTNVSGDYGIAVLNDSKYGSDKPADDVLRLTLLYTPEVGLSQYQDQASQDFGRHDMLYAIAGHAGSWSQADVPWQAARLNQPLLPFATVPHAGRLGRSFSLVQVSGRQLQVTALKKAEDSSALIVRLKEVTGRPAKAQLTTAGGIVQAEEMTGQERHKGPASLHQGTLNLDLPAYGLRTYALTLAEPAGRPAFPQSFPLALPYNVDVASPDTQRADGAFDRAGRTLPAEMMPDSFEREGVQFVFGPRTNGAKNAVTCAGQTLTLPSPATRRLDVLAAADGDVQTTLRIQDQGRPWFVQDWSGFIGSWDNRLWQGEIPEEAFLWPYPLDGLVPGFIKRAPIAWLASHRHHPKNGNEFYQYSYVFKHSFPVPPGAKTITLPRHPNIRVLAITAVAQPHPPLSPAAPLSDTLENRLLEEPRLIGPAELKTDSFSVALEPPLYWKADGLRYTVDGRDPSPSSPLYTKPLLLSTSTTIKARQFLQGQAGPILTQQVPVNDQAPPRVTRAFAVPDSREIKVVFSEPVAESSATPIAHYQAAGLTIVKVVPSAAGTEARLMLAQPLTASVPLEVHGLTDRSPRHNVQPPQTIAVELPLPFYRQLSPEMQGPLQAESRFVEDLPVQYGDQWTLNLFVKTGKAPENRTLIAGFGTANEKRDGQGRYFAKFANGIHFWTRRADVETTTPLDIGEWQMLTATYDGKWICLYKNGQPIARQTILLRQDQPIVQWFPRDPWDKKRQFDGSVRNLTIWKTALAPEMIAQIWNVRPKFP